MADQQEQTARGAPRPGQHDLTSGPIAPAMLMFALPTLAANVLQTLNGSVNTIWVGHFLGETALAATANANIIMFLMFGAVFGFGMAATVLIGQAMGRRDVVAARRAFAGAIGLVGGSAIVIAILGWLFSPAILRLLATPKDSYPLALDYLRVSFAGLPFVMVLVLAQMGLRGVGDAKTPLWFSAFSVLLDSGLNPFLIRGIGPFPEMGIAGSATASLIANLCAFAGMIVYFYRRDLPLRLRGHEFAWLRPAPELVRFIVAKGVPMGAQMIIISTAGLAMTGLINREGVDTAAAYGVAQQVWNYIQMPGMAIGAAVSTMAAQNIGAKRWDRVDAITRVGLTTILTTSLTMVVITAMLDRTILALFLPSDSPAMPIAQHIHLIVVWSFVLFGVSMVLTAAVRANGVAVPPLIMMTIAFYPIRLGCALTLLPRYGIDGLWWSFPISSAANAMMSAAYYRFGRWRGDAHVPLAPEEGLELAQGDAEPAGRTHPSG